MHAHADSVATTETCADGVYSYHDPIRTHSDAIKAAGCHPPPPCPKPQPPNECDPSPGAKEKTTCRSICETILIFITFLIGLGLFIALIYLTYMYGYEKGYDEGYDDGYWVGSRISKQKEEPEIDVTAEGGPCRRWSEGVCREADDAQWAIRQSRHYLKKGDAESAIGKWSAALKYYRAAMDLGRGVGAQSALYAAKRIQFQSMSCDFTDESLARISRDFDKNPLGALITMKQKQQALQGLGFYNGNIDNKHGPDTRTAIRKFQGELWFDQTGVLTAEQTVLLICGGAQIAKDISSQNVLGVMYAGGLGVRQNTDFALDWLSAAAQRNDADAAWNLALMYGTQTVLSSVKVCDAVQNAERADSYLSEAASAGHPAAKLAKRKYAHLTPEKRWRKISGDLNQPEALRRVGRGCNPNN